MTGDGFLALDRHAVDFTLRAYDLMGRERPEWSAYCSRATALASATPVRNWDIPDWPDRTRAFFADIPLRGKLAAVAGIRLR